MLIRISGSNYVERSICFVTSLFYRIN